MRPIAVRIRRLLEQDPRYKPGAYQFIQEALAYAQRELQMGELQPTELGGEPADPGQPPLAPHLTGQQLCEAARRFALDQYGFLAQPVLRSWGLCSTRDFGEVVFNLIRIGVFKKSKRDRREDFDNVYDFADAFHYEMRAGL